MLGILDYGAGNLRSVCNALDRLGQQYFVSDDPAALDKADKIIFPGVGHAAAAMEALRNKQIDSFLIATQKPILGLCLGMQLFFDFSEEGETECLGIIPGRVVRFRPEEVGIVPHMGWNQVNYKFGTWNRVQGTGDNADYYFVHSYYCVPREQSALVGETAYGKRRFCSVVKQGNVIGAQFHPEKSGLAGAAFLQLFCSGILFDEHEGKI